MERKIESLILYFNGLHDLKESQESLAVPDNHAHVTLGLNHTSHNSVSAIKLSLVYLRPDIICCF